MHIDKDDLYVPWDFCEFHVGHPKGIVGRGHEHAPLKIKDRSFFSRFCLYHSKAASWIAGGIIRRSQDSRILVEILHDFLFIPNMIAGGEHIDSPVEKLISNFGRHAKTRSRIFAVQNREIDRELFLQLLEVMVDDGTPGFTDRVADEENFHRKRKTPQQACGITYLNLLIQVGFLSAL